MTLLCLLAPILAVTGVCEPPPFDIDEIREAAQPPEPEPPTEAKQEPAPEAQAQPERGRYGVGEPWSSLAECESGNWIDGGADFVDGSARWDWAKPGTEVPPWGTTIHHGGLQFLPATWEWVAGDLGLLGAYPHAYDAPPSVQVQVAEVLQDRQGWGAWPVCSRKIGLR